MSSSVTSWSQPAHCRMQFTSAIKAADSSARYFSNHSWATVFAESPDPKSSAITRQHKSEAAQNKALLTKQASAPLASLDANRLLGPARETSGMRSARRLRPIDLGLLRRRLPCATCLRLLPRPRRRMVFVALVVVLVAHLLVGFRDLILGVLVVLIISLALRGGLARRLGRELGWGFHNASGTATRRCVAFGRRADVIVHGFAKRKSRSEHLADRNAGELIPEARATMVLLANLSRLMSREAPNMPGLLWKVGAPCFGG